MSDNVWSVPATVVDVLTGDTLLLRLDLGWRITLDARCRLIGVRAPSLDEKDGRSARAWTRERVSSAEVIFISHAMDGYGCSVGQVMVSTPQGEPFDLGLDLLNSGHAVQW